jgi:methylphosphotriester-DNA--protein-cysteine methyltransferase
VQENRRHTQELVAAIDRLAALAGEADGSAVRAGGNGTLVVTATGTMLHRPDCPVVANREGVRRVKADAPGFEPCKICEPELIDLTA